MAEEKGSFWARISKKLL